jgi:hypothetical protein
VIGSLKLWKRKAPAIGENAKPAILETSADSSTTQQAAFVALDEMASATAKIPRQTVGIAGNDLTTEKAEAAFGSTGGIKTSDSKTLVAIAGIDLR